MSSRAEQAETATQPVPRGLLARLGLRFPGAEDNAREPDQGNGPDWPRTFGG